MAHFPPGGACCGSVVQLIRSCIRRVRLPRSAMACCGSVVLEARGAGWPALGHSFLSLPRPQLRQP